MEVVVRRKWENERYKILIRVIKEQEGYYTTETTFWKRKRNGVWELTTNRSKMPKYVQRKADELLHG